jgi:putative Ca2+/H+ antiporter (TMEM165/GDT1 family)
VMTREGKWWVVGGIVAAAAAALALGVPFGTLLIVAAILACPLAMYFGMRGMGMGEESRHSRMDGPSPLDDGERDTEDHAHHMAHRKP